jgi:hypothetical protein
MNAKRFRPALLVALMASALAIAAIDAQAGNSGSIDLDGKIGVGSTQLNGSAVPSPVEASEEIDEPLFAANDTTNLASETERDERAEQGCCGLAVATIALLITWMPLIGVTFGWFPTRARA